MNELIDEDLTDIALFARVVEAGGFTAATRLVGVPQSTISRRVAALESKLGTRLLDRTTRKVSPTEAGLRIFTHARRIIDEMESTQAVAASMLEEPSGLIRITAPVVFGQHLLGPAIAEFLINYPKVKFYTELSGRRVDLIEEGFDIAIRVGELEDSSLVKILITKANAALYATPSIAAQVRSPHDLQHVEWLHAGLRHGVTEWQLIDRETLKIEHKIKKHPIVTGSEVQVLIDSAKAGIGVAVLPEFAAPPELVRLLPNYLIRQVEINALIVSRKSIVPAITHFIQFLKEFVSK